MIKRLVEKEQPFLIMEENIYDEMTAFCVVYEGRAWNGNFTILQKPIKKKEHFQEFRQFKHLFKVTNYEGDGRIYDFNDFKTNVDKRLKKNFLKTL